jgi:hypothetical protein
MSALEWMEKPPTQQSASKWNRSSSRGFGLGFHRAPYSGWGPAMTQQFYGWATAENASLPSTCSTTESTSTLQELKPAA